MRHVPAGTRSRRNQKLPALRKGVDPQQIRVFALLATERDVSRWRKQLRLGTPARRAGAVVALGARQGVAAALLLSRALLRDSAAMVRIHAAEALGRTAGATATKALTRAWPGERDSHVQAAILLALGHCKPANPVVERVLAEGLAHADGVVIEAALWSLHRRGQAVAAEHACSLAVHPSAGVRRVALQVLLEVGGCGDVIHAARSDADRSVALLARAVR